MIDWALEAVVLPVTDIDRSVVFYRDQVGFRLDHDTQTEHAHVVRLTPAGSGCSIVFGDLPSQNQMESGSMRGLQLAVSDAKAAWQELLDRGVTVSDLTVTVDGHRRTHFEFRDPDGNSWSVHEIEARAPVIARDQPGLWKWRSG